MKITLVSETFWPQTNGVSRVLGRWFDYARQQGHQVQLVIPKYKEREGNPNEIGLPSIPFPLYPEVRVCFSIPGLVWNKIRRFEPDLIHIATEGPLGLSMLWKARKSPIPVVSSYHTSFSQYSRDYYLGFLEEQVWNYLRWFHNSCLRTYCPSDMTKDEITSRGFKRVEVWSRGVDTETFNPDRRNDQIRSSLGLDNEAILGVYVGRLAKEKNLPLLLRTFPRMREAVPQLQLMLVGDGPIRARLEKEKPEGVHCVGYKRGVELAEHYASGDMFLFPSVTETFGNVVLEALACGLPTVAFQAGGVPQSVHHHENGLLAEEGDEDAFLQYAIQLCREHETRKQMAQAAWDYAQTQTWERIMGRLFTSYQKVLEEQNPTY